MNLIDLDDSDVSAQSSLAPLTPESRKEFGTRICCVLGCHEPATFMQTASWTVDRLHNTTRIFWCKEHKPE